MPNSLNLWQESSSITDFAVLDWTFFSLLYGEICKYDIIALQPNHWRRLKELIAFGKSRRFFNPSKSAVRKTFLANHLSKRLAGDIFLLLSVRPLFSLLCTFHNAEPWMITLGKRNRRKESGKNVKFNPNQRCWQTAGMMTVITKKIPSAVDKYDAFAKDMRTQCSIHLEWTFGNILDRISKALTSKFHQNWFNVML